MRTIQVVEEAVSALAAYAQVPIAFDVRAVLEVVGEAPPFELSARELTRPWRKDYDALDGGPLGWPEQFDLSTWQLFAARIDGQRVGGAAVVRDTADAATLWDLRVAPSARRCGVATALFETAARWAHARGCARLIVETQNINVPACRFYERQGCELAEVERDAYPDLPDETKLVLTRHLPGSS